MGACRVYGGDKLCAATETTVRGGTRTLPRELFTEARPRCRTRVPEPLRSLRWS